ncbi:MAG: hypothetical protein JWN95_1859 [Frankiales bacterium]|nr:hypothetical protein [Frankiales bacterium]
MATIELTEAEIKLLRNALIAFEKDFGHDEADVVNAVKRLLARLDTLT